MYSPDLNTFLKLATQGNLIPVTRRVLADFETPLSISGVIRSWAAARAPSSAKPAAMWNGSKTGKSWANR
jgi:hypothetical protein